MTPDAGLPVTSRAGRIAGDLGSFAAFAARRERREHEDHQALAELSARPLPLPAGVEIESLGTAGYRLTAHGSTLLVDPYLSRVPLLATLRRRPALPDPGALTPLLARDLGDVAGILVGHTHFDHAVDAPALSRALSAPVYGSDSLVRLMALHGAAGSAIEVEPHHRYELGPFTVTFVPSLHSKLVLGLAVPMDGALSCEHLDHLSPRAYKCGAIYGIRIEVDGTVIYHQGSANLLDDEVPQGADVFLAGIAGRRFTDAYWERILRKLDPAVVVASHFDDFFRPIDAPTGFSTNVDLASFPDEIAAVSGSAAITALRPGQVARGG